MSVTEYYEYTLELLDKTIDAPTTIATTGRIINGDLTPFRHRLELVNTGNSKTDNGVMTLRIPPDGTFIRTAPILIDEGAKDRFVIQAQIRQSDGAGGTRKGKIFRFTVGAPTIQDDEGGETLKVQLIPTEYRIKEHLTSKQLKFFSPRSSFEKRLTDYNITRGSSEPAVVISINNVDPDDDSIQLPDDDENLKQNWEPLAPTVTWDLLKEVIDRLSLPSVGGGTFQDHYFEFEGSNAVPFAGDITSGSINAVDVRAEKFGETDSGIILDPLSLSSPVDAEKDKTIMTDLVRFKNNIIMEGSSRGGTLPMERARFNSDWQHGQNRPEYNASNTYFDGSDNLHGQSKVKVIQISAANVRVTRYFEYIGTNGSSSTDNPVGASNTDWFEDFTTIPPYNVNAQYEENELVYIDTGGVVSWFILDLGKTHQAGDTIPSSNPDWISTFISVLSTIHAPFFSYTPWTSDFNLQKANISDQNSPATGFVGVVPDWNYERANFDRVVSEDQFEQVSLKSVIRAERTQASIPSHEIVNGARFLINGVGVGTDFAGHDNEVAEWFEPPFETGVWKFSKTSATFETNEMVTNLNTGQVFGWNGSSWSVEWDPQTSNGPISSPFHAVSDGSTILGGITGFGLVVGATGIPAQAIRLTFNWDAITGDDLNLSSRGAWWVQHLPIPRIPLGSHTTGDIYANPTLDTVNLDLDHKGQQGWNNGLDSESLGRISALTMKVRLSINDLGGNLVNQYANMPFKAWAIDVFGRIWYSDFTVRRNGSYSFVRIAFGDNAPQKLHHNRIDELFGAFGFTFSQNFFLKEKQFTGIEFDWRFVKSWGIFWNVAYDDNGMYIGVRDHFVQTLEQWAHQIGSFALAGITLGAIKQGSLVIDHVHLDIDELGFEKQLFANSDDTKIATARTEIGHLASETDYLNLKGRAQGEKARKEFVNQQWHMLAHGDVRMRLGQTFKITGSRVPEQISNYSAFNAGTTYAKGDKVALGGFVYQSLQDNNLGNAVTLEQWWTNLNESVCAEVKHIIDSDGYTMQILGVRKFVF